MGMRASILPGTAFGEKAAPEVLSTGIEGLDRLLFGGIPRGHLIEVVGPPSSGKTSLLFSILSQATVRGEWVAYIDSFASLDPAFAQKAGVNLQHLLWARGGTFFSPEKTLKAADILARAGGLGAVVLDLESPGKAATGKKRIPFHSWFRLKRTIEGTPTILMVLGREAITASAATVVISLRRRLARWHSTAESSSIRHGRLLRGICTEAELLRGKNFNHATFHCHF